VELHLLELELHSVDVELLLMNMRAVATACGRTCVPHAVHHAVLPAAVSSAVYVGMSSNCSYIKLWFASSSIVLRFKRSDYNNNILIMSMRLLYACIAVRLVTTEVC
jgi:hypothetical protein